MHHREERSGRHQMNTSGSPSRFLSGSLPRVERRRGGPEDFEMIERTHKALALLEPKWSLDVIFLLATGMRRHARLVDNIPGISKKVLTSTLRKLEQNGIVSRHVYPEIPVRVERALSPRGRHLTDPLMALYESAEAHEEDLATAPTEQASTLAQAAFSL